LVLNSLLLLVSLAAHRNSVSGSPIKDEAGAKVLYDAHIACNAKADETQRLECKMAATVAAADSQMQSVLTKGIESEITAIVQALEPVCISFPSHAFNFSIV
jgi:hypothetical protein